MDIGGSEMEITGMIWCFAAIGCFMVFISSFDNKVVALTALYWMVAAGVLSYPTLLSESFP